MTSRTVSLALLVVAAVSGFAATGEGSTGVAVLSLASVAAVLAVPPRGRPVLGLTLVAVAVVVGAAQSMAGLGDAALLVSVGALAGAGLLVAARGRRWPSLARRYGGAGGGDDSDREPADLWRALDRGEDPTASDAPEPPAGEPGPRRSSVD